MSVPKVLLAADNDRDMLEYLHDAFQAEVSVCDQCGYEEPTSTCDSVSDLKEYLDRFPVPPQPVYDETKERKLFQSFAVNRRGGYGNLPFFVFARKENGEYMDGTSELAWKGWKACAQSRAKAGEVGHE